MMIEGVPETIPRSKILELIEAVGLPLKNLLEFRIEYGAVVAKVRALDERGRPYFAKPGDRNAKPATHDISIRIVDDEDG
jgi:hypothetical protein